jgi:hypothetical protein
VSDFGKISERIRESWQDELYLLRDSLGIESDQIPFGVCDGVLLFQKMMPADDYIAWNAAFSTGLLAKLPKFGCNIEVPQGGELRPENITLRRFD